MSSFESDNIRWTEVNGKEARGINDADFGEVQEVGTEFVITKKGIANKDRFYLPRTLADRFDGNKLYFRITEEEAKVYKRD